MSSTSHCPMSFMSSLKTDLLSPESRDVDANRAPHWIACSMLKGRMWKLRKGKSVMRCLTSNSETAMVDRYKGTRRRTHSRKYRWATSWNGRFGSANVIRKLVSTRTLFNGLPPVVFLPTRSRFQRPSTLRHHGSSCVPMRFHRYLLSAQ